MWRFMRDRLLTTLLTVWGASTLAFLALRLLPGDAITNQMLQGGASPASIAARRAALGLESPLPIQYARFLLDLTRGDLGYSYLTQQPVSVLIGEQLGATVSLASAALVIAIILGLTLGMIEAFYWPRWPGQFAGALNVLALASPIYWTATLGIYVFSTQLDLLPATGSGSPTHLLLPAGVLGFHVAGSIARVTRTSLRRTQEAPFVRTAYAKGLRGSQILFGHVLRASFPPILSIIALQTGFLLGGTVITEMIFVRQGIGQLLQHAVIDQDYPVVLGVVVLAAITYSVVNTLADIGHGLLDPRLRPAEES